MTSAENNTPAQQKKKSPLTIVLWVVIALAVAGAVYAIAKQSTAEKGNVVDLWVKDQMVEQIVLDPAKTEQRDLKEQYGVPMKMEIKDGKVRFYDVECPDQICVHVGFIGQEGEMAVCLPNQTALIMEEQK